MTNKKGNEDRTLQNWSLRPVFLPEEERSVNGPVWEPRSPLGQAYFLEFSCILTTIIPGLAFLFTSLEFAVLNYSVG